MKMRPTQTLYAILLFGFILMMAAGHILAQVPSLLEYDGYMTGNITGNRTIAVRLYDASTNGTLLYKETIGTVKVTQGQFYFQYGQNGTAGNGTTPTTIGATLTGSQQWLALTVNGTEQSPRERLVAVPFALKSGDGQQVIQDLRMVTQAIGRTINALGGNYSSVSGNLSAAVGTLESKSRQFQSLQAIQNEFKVVGVSGNLSFGSVALQNNSTRTLTITNSGYAKLNVSGITLPSGFSGTWSGVVASGGSQAVAVKFLPTQVKAYSGNITIASDATSGSGVIAVSGSGVNFQTPTLKSVMVTVQGGTLPLSSGLVSAGFGFRSQSPEQLVASFEIGKYEVTWGEWNEVRAWALSHGYTLQADVGNTYPRGSGNDFPVIDVSYDDAIKWCNAKSEKEGKTPFYTTRRWDSNSNRIITVTYGTWGEGVPSIGSGNGYRLPSEKEWEWAARGGVKTHGYYYSGSNVSSEVAWTSENSSGGTKAVGTKMPNELGIYDMEGNVVEWCEDYPLFSEGGLFRRFRGSSWSSNSSLFSSIETPDLNYCGADQRYNGFGFRLARSSGN